MADYPRHPYWKGEAMDIKRVPRQVLTDLLLRKSQYTFEMLPLRIMITRLQSKVNRDPAYMDECIGELLAYFENQRLPNAQKDLAILCEAGGVRQ